MQNSMVQLYCGEGKGKTTAAVGAAIRCAGAGGRVLFFQFLKGNSSSELNILNKLDGINLLDGFYSSKFVWDMSDSEKALAARFYSDKFNEIAGLVKNGEYDMLVTDEIFDAVDCGFVSIEQILHFLRIKPKGLEVVMTGRNPGRQLTEAADYVTYMQKIKHPFDRGISARKMIEY